MTKYTFSAGSAGALAVLLVAACGRVGIDLSAVSDLEAERFDAGLGARLDAGPGARFDTGPEGGTEPPGGEGGAAAEAGGGVGPTRPADASPPDADPGPAPDAGDAAEDDPPPPDAGAGQRGVRIFVDHATGTEDLVGYAARIVMDTATLIAEGTLSADCRELRVRGGPACAEDLPFFVPAHSCGSTATEVWVRLPPLAAGQAQVLSVAFDGAGQGSDGNGVFDFFDDFSGQDLDAARWNRYGNGRITVSGGILESQGAAMLATAADVMAEQQGVAGVRIAARSVIGTDVELGVGQVTAVPNAHFLWAFESPSFERGRSWDGVTFLSADRTVYGFHTQQSTCDNTQAQTPTPLGSAWTDVAPASPSFLTAEFRYRNRRDRTEASMSTSRGQSFSLPLPAGCTLPARLPVLIGLDHHDDPLSSTDDVPVQRVDYVYVRRHVDVAPVVTVISDSALACGPQ